MSDQATVIIRSGFASKCGGVVKSWKRRWFVLKSNGFLYYYDSANCKNEKGKIDVINSSTISLWQAESCTDKLPSNFAALNSFTVGSPGRMYTCVCDSSEDASEWIEALNKVRKEQHYPPPTYPKAGPTQAPPPPPTSAMPPQPQTQHAMPQPAAGYAPPPMPHPSQPHPYMPQGAPMPHPPMPQGGQPRPYMPQGAPMPHPPMPQGPYMPQPMMPQGGPPMPRPQYFQPGPPGPYYPPQYPPPPHQQGYYRPPPPASYYPQAPPPRPAQYAPPGGPYYQPCSSQQSSVNVTIVNI